MSVLRAIMRAKANRKKSFFLGCALIQSFVTIVLARTLREIPMGPDFHKVRTLKDFFTTLNHTVARKAYQYRKKGCNPPSRAEPGSPRINVFPTRYKIAPPHTLDLA